MASARALRVDHQVVEEARHPGRGGTSLARIDRQGLAAHLGEERMVAIAQSPNPTFAENRFQVLGKRRILIRVELDNGNVLQEILPVGDHHSVHRAGAGVEEVPPLHADRLRTEIEGAAPCKDVVNLVAAVDVRFENPERPRHQDARAYTHDVNIIHRPVSLRHCPRWGLVRMFAIRSGTVRRKESGPCLKRSNPRQALLGRGC